MRSRIAVALAALVLGVVGTVDAHATPRDDAWTKRLTVQPGMPVYNPHYDLTCTSGFLLKDSRGGRYVVVDAHCAPDGRFKDGAGFYTPYVGARTWPRGAGPMAQRDEPRHRTIGYYVAQVVPDRTYDVSYAIIQLDKGIAYDGTVAVVGGPRRQPFAGTTSEPMPVTYVCQDNYGADDGTTSYGYDDGVRQDVAPTGVGSPAFALATPANGICAGAPVLGFDGSALGIHSQWAMVWGSNSPQSAPQGTYASGPPVYRLDAIIAAAQQQLHVPLTLLQSGEKGVTRS
jgi:hypothetical protein